MATTAMSTYSFTILVKEGTHPPITLRCNGAEVFPGMPVTRNGHTYPDCALPDAIGESVVGVAGLLDNQDIDTVYSDNTEIPVYECGGGAIVRMYHAANGGSVVHGDIMVSQTIEAAGHVETLAKALTDFTAGGDTLTMIATQIKNFFSIVGRAAETHASVGTVTPIKVLLSI